jgi:hypothetical protein
VGELDSPEDGATIERGSDLRRPKYRIDVATEVQSADPGNGFTDEPDNGVETLKMVCAATTID